MLSKKLTIATLAGAAALMLSSQASADVLGVLQGQANNTSGWSTLHSSVTANQTYTRGAGIISTGNVTGFFSTQFDSNTEAGALTANNTVTWGLDFDQPWDLDLFSIRYVRSSTPAAQGGGPTTLVIQISVNGGAFAAVHNDTAISTTGEDNLNLDLTAFDNVTSVDFRYIGWWGNGGAPNLTGQFGFQNATAGTLNGNSFRLEGTATVIPEPAIAGLLGLISLGLLRRRHA